MGVSLSQVPTSVMIQHFRSVVFAALLGSVGVAQSAASYAIVVQEEVHKEAAWKAVCDSAGRELWRYFSGHKIERIGGSKRPVAAITR